MIEKKILVVEDDYLNRRLTKKVLTDNNYTVFEAKNANIAMETLLKERIDLAILDIHLGDGQMDGIELSQQIDQLFHLPIIFLSAYDKKHFQDLESQIQTKGFLSKPFKNSELLDAIEMTLS